MKIVVAPDKFKGSISGKEFCRAVEDGFLRVFPYAEVLKIPLADGGDGTIEVLEEHIPGGKRTIEVMDPLMRRIRASYLYDAGSKTAFVEMAEASGMRLLATGDQNCYHTTSYGTGQLIKNALEQGAEKIILGIGGSATNDAGIGMAAALGYQFLDKDGKELIPVGKNLVHIKYLVDKRVDPQLKKAKFAVACDVTNPLYGANGAAYVYGPQKGASKEEIELLDAGLRNISRHMKEHFGFEVDDVPGAGAAGGMGAGAMAFLSATLVSGIELLLDLLDMEKELEGADWVITGEGKLDGQTLSGKTIQGLTRVTRKKQIPVAAFCGSISVSREELAGMGIQYAAALMDKAASLDDAIHNASGYLEDLTFDFASLLKNNPNFNR